MTDEDTNTDNPKPEGEETTETTTEVVKPNSSFIDEAKEVNKERREILKAETELQTRKEKLHAEQMIGGHAVAGREKEKKKELSNQDYADKALAGDYNVKE